MSKATTMVNHETGHICVIYVTDDHQLIELDVPLEVAIVLQEALAQGRKELEN